MKKLKYIFLMSLAVSFVACDVNNDLDVITETPVVFPDANPGSADFSNFVAIGASFSAGFSDGSVFLAAQTNSFPKIMSDQMIAMGGGSFIQPLVSDNVGGLLYGGQQIANPRFYFNGSAPTLLSGTPTTEVTTKLTGSFNNYGIPGVKSYHIVAPGYGSTLGVLAGTANPYFARMSSSETTTVLGDAVAQNATFFSLSEIGGNDVLGYATSGGVGTVHSTNVDATTYKQEDITSPLLFDQVLKGMVASLTAGGAKGVLVTIPPIVNLPFFTTVPYNPVPMDAETAALANQGYAPYNNGIKQAFGALVLQGFITKEMADAEIAKRTINFDEGQNAVVIVDENLTNLEALNPAFTGLKQYRQATQSDLLLLTSSSFIGTTVDSDPLLINGVSVPLEDRWVLTPEEQQAIQTATDAYNASITLVASENGLALADLNKLLNDAVARGIQFDEFSMTTSLVFGGLVSLDGIHLTTRGYALMANKILEAIDKTYGSNFVESGNVAKAANYPTNYPSGI